MKAVKKLDCLMLIDDDDATNYLHEMVVSKEDCTDTLLIYEKAEKALDYLTAIDAPGYKKPELILLDLNMPRMTGWEFLEEFSQLNEQQKSNITILILSTSMNPMDIEMSKKNPYISGFYMKPLTEKILKEILDNHFAHYTTT